MKQVLFLFLLIITFSINLEAQVKEFIGLTNDGGKYGDGTIFMTDENGNNFNTVVDMPKNIGSLPGEVQLVETPNGKLYGAVAAGRGLFSQLGLQHGVLFEYDPSTNQYEVKVFFDSTKGSNPRHGLLLASNGKLYGTTNNTGLNNRGTLYEYDPQTELFTKLHDFNQASGATSLSKPVQASNGLLYGMTYSGGTFDKGVIYSYDLTNSIYTKLHDFDGINGEGPRGALFIGSNGNLFGLTPNGGANNYGVIFEFNIQSNTYTLKASFNGTNGKYPNGGLTELSPGHFWGVTVRGGTFDDGTIFEYDAVNNLLTTQFNFDEVVSGSLPQGSLYLASNGNLFGSAGLGGTYDRGVIFEFNPLTGTFTKRFEFPNLIDGFSCPGTLMQNSKGKMYGITRWGGASSYAGGSSIGDGVLFEYDINTYAYTRKLDFDESIEGRNPKAGLLQASNGKVYGINQLGGRYGKGVLFEFDVQSRKVIPKVHFDGDNGYSISNGLMEASNGKLYGLSYYGGTNNHGTIFEYNPVQDTLIKRFDFDSLSSGMHPIGELVQRTNGKLYGLCNRGGTNNRGTIFEFDPSTGSFLKRYDFNNSLNGPGSPDYGFTLVGNTLYGVANGGGFSTPNAGVLFRFVLSSNSLSTRVSFDGAVKGSNPVGPLVLSNGKLYGVTESGGANNKGVLYEYTISNNSFLKKMNFGGSVALERPNGALTLASNGKFYGLCSEGGATGYGAFYEYDLNTNTITAKTNLNEQNGNYPYKNRIIEVNTCYNTRDSILVSTCENYTLPSGKATYNLPGNYVLSDTIANQCNSDSILTIFLTVNKPDTSVFQNTYTLSSNQDSASYQWLDCGNNYSIISGETSQIFTASMPGTYAVEITKNNCVDTSACIALIGVGISTNSSSSLTISPNPFKDNIIVYLGNENSGSMKVLDLMGKTIVSELNIRSNEPIDLDLPSGVYFIQLRVNDELYLKKIVKE